VAWHRTRRDELAGTEGGVAAAKSGHYAVMSPGSHCYFDHYQGDPANEPLAIGGYTTVQKVYSYEPIPAELNARGAKYILGAQGNVWTEYILTPSTWSTWPCRACWHWRKCCGRRRRSGTRRISSQRLEKEFPRLEAMKVNASKSLYQVSSNSEQDEGIGPC
jgi:hexosaminidase